MQLTSDYKNQHLSFISRKKRLDLDFVLLLYTKTLLVYTF